MSVHRPSIDRRFKRTHEILVNIRHWTIDKIVIFFIYRHLKIHLGERNYPRLDIFRINFRGETRAKFPIYAAIDVVEYRVESNSWPIVTVYQGQRGWYRLSRVDRCETRMRPRNRENKSISARVDRDKKD